MKSRLHKDLHQLFRSRDIFDVCSAYRSSSELRNAVATDTWLRAGPAFRLNPDYRRVLFICRWLLRIQLFGIDDTLFQYCCSSEFPDLERLSTDQVQDVLAWSFGKGPLPFGIKEKELSTARQSANRANLVQQVIEACGGAPRIIKHRNLLFDRWLAPVWLAVPASPALLEMPEPVASRLRVFAATRLYVDLNTSKSTHELAMEERRAIAQGLDEAAPTIGAQARNRDFVADFHRTRGLNYFILFKLGKDLADLDAAIQAFRDARADARPDKSSTIVLLLAQMLQRRWSTGAEHIDEIVSLFLDARQRLAFDPEDLFSLGLALTEQYRVGKGNRDLRFIAKVWSDCVTAYSFDSKRKDEAQVHLARTLHLLSLKDPDVEDATLVALMRSLDTRLLAPDDRQELSILAAAHLRNRLVDKHDKTAAVTAIRLLHEAASPSATAPPFGLAAAATGTALDLIDDGAESVLSRWLWLAKEAFAAEGGTFERFDLASLSSQVHFALWQKRALLENLDETIGEASEALKLTSGRSYKPQAIAALLQVRGASLLDRFELFNRSHDFEQALLDLQQAAQLWPAAAIINSLAVGMIAVWRQAGAKGQELAPIVGMVESTLNERPADPDARWLRWTLANLHLLQLRSTGAIPFLKRAADLVGAAMQEWGKPLPTKLTLAACQIYNTAFALTGDTTYIDEGILIVERLLENQEIPEKERYIAEIELADCYRQRFEVVRDPKDAQRAIVGFRAILDRYERTGSQGVNVRATLAALLADQGLSTGNFDILAEAKELALQVGPTPSEIASLPEPTRNRIAIVFCTTAETDQALNQWLAIFRDNARKLDDVTAALGAALNWAEQARFHRNWKEALSAFDAAAALRTSGLERNLERGDRELWLKAFQGLTSMAAEAHVALGDYHCAAAVLDSNQGLLARTAVNDGSRFTVDAPDLFDEVCFLIAGRTEGFALRRVNGSLTRISLPQLTERVAYDWAEEPWSACSSMGELVIKRMLVQAHLGARLLLIPIGRLAVLPWTAASVDGRPLLETTRIHVLPSTAFIHSRFCDKIERALFVKYDKAPGEADLEHANAEVEWARTFVSPHTYIAGEQATKDAVLASISGHQLIHISGHATSNLMSPMDSSIFLADGERLKLRDVYELELRGTRLVVLAGCETGLSGNLVPEEICNFAFGFVAAGAGGAIGTLWRVGDRSASLLLRRFYWEWLREKNNPAEALRLSQLWLRNTTNGEKHSWLSATSDACDDAEVNLRRALSESPDTCSNRSPKSWAPFIYFGV